MNRTKMIGWTAFAFCLLGYGTFTAAIVIVERVKISSSDFTMRPQASSYVTFKDGGTNVRCSIF